MSQKSRYKNKYAPDIDTSELSPGTYIDTTYGLFVVYPTKVGKRWQKLTKNVYDILKKNRIKLKKLDRQCETKISNGDQQRSKQTTNRSKETGKKTLTSSKTPTGSSKMRNIEVRPPYTADGIKEGTVLKYDGRDYVVVGIGKNKKWTVLTDNLKYRLERNNIKLRRITNDEMETYQRLINGKDGKTTKRIRFKSDEKKEFTKGESINNRKKYIKMENESEDEEYVDDEESHNEEYLDDEESHNEESDDEEYGDYYELVKTSAIERIKNMNIKDDQKVKKEKKKMEKENISTRGYNNKSKKNIDLGDEDTWSSCSGDDDYQYDDFVVSDSEY